MQRLAAEGRTVFVSSHLLSEMALTADHLVVIGRGRLIADLPTQQFIDRASESAVRLRSPQLDTLREVLTQQGVGVRDDIGPQGPQLIVTGTTTDAIGHLAGQHGITLYELAPQHASLEEAFMKLTGGETEYHAQDMEQAMGGAL